MLVIPIISRHTAVTLWLATKCQRCGEINFSDPLITMCQVYTKEETKRAWTGAPASSQWAGWLAVSDCCSLRVFLQTRQKTWRLWLWHRLATLQWCEAVLWWWSVWQKANRSPWCPGAGKVRDILAEIGLQCLTFTICSINKWGTDTWWGGDRGRRL